MSGKRFSTIWAKAILFMGIVLPATVLGGAIGHHIAQYRMSHGISPAWQRYELHVGDLTYKQLVSTEYIMPGIQEPAADELKVFAITTENILYLVTQDEAREILPLPDDQQFHSMAINEQGDLMIWSSQGETRFVKTHQLEPGNEPLPQPYHTRDCTSSDYFQEYFRLDDQSILDTVGIILSTDIGQSIRCYVLLENNQIQYWKYDYTWPGAMSSELNWIVVGMIAGAILGIYAFMIVKNSYYVVS
ncbi:MAG: hypothetical protein KJ069_30085 [Anaerolineae bacterium]|nr:hypothetical protein [Anaerolineae bacterium]